MPVQRMYVVISCAKTCTDMRLMPMRTRTPPCTTS